jgi:hypothetical protein
MRTLESIKCWDYGLVVLPTPSAYSQIQQEHVSRHRDEEQF